MLMNALNYPLVSGENIYIYSNSKRGWGGGSDYYGWFEVACVCGAGMSFLALESTESTQFFSTRDVCYSL